MSELADPDQRDQDVCGFCGCRRHGPWTTQRRTVCAVAKGKDGSPGPGTEAPQIIEWKRTACSQCKRVRLERFVSSADTHEEAG